MIPKSEGKVSITEQKPGITSYEDFDVFSGKDGVSRDEYKMSTFHNAGQEDGDATFHKTAELMETTGATVLGEDEKGETETEKQEESAAVADR